MKHTPGGCVFFRRKQSKNQLATRAHLRPLLRHRCECCRFMESGATKKKPSERLRLPRLPALGLKQTKSR